MNEMIMDVVTVNMKLSIDGDSDSEFIDRVETAADEFMEDVEKFVRLSIREQLGEDAEKVTLNFEW